MGILAVWLAVSPPPLRSQSPRATSDRLDVMVARDALFEPRAPGERSVLSDSARVITPAGRLVVAREAGVHVVITLPVGRTTALNAPALLLRNHVEPYQPVLPDVRGGGPRYPTNLRARGVPGDVLATFVVDADGRTVPASTRILHASHPDFAAAVREYLVRASFIPARLGGCRIGARVSQPFTFAVEGAGRPLFPDTSTGAPRDSRRPTAIPRSP